MKILRFIGLFIKKLLRFVLKPLSFVPAILMMCIIYGLSGQNASQSSKLSYQVTYTMVTVADEVGEMELSEARRVSLTERLHPYVRKMAHFTEYLLLAMAVALPLYVYGLRGFWLVIFAGAVCVGFACLDEYHQGFVQGRGPSKKDVVIDSCGSFLGIFITRFFGFIGRKTIFAPLAIHKDRKKKK
ncbi:MAG: VanZ family protein [Lachnospiraceae bacterium]|nr:VanZ family protein [Lachnospiraceae bacterium]